MSGKPTDGPSEAERERRAEVMRLLEANLRALLTQPIIEGEVRIKLERCLATVATRRADERATELRCGFKRLRKKP